MTWDNFTVNKVCVAGVSFVGALSIFTLAGFYLVTGSPTIVWLGLLYIALVMICGVLFVLYLRRRLVLFSDDLCQLIDRMLDEDPVLPTTAQEENLFYKVNHRLLRLYEIMEENRRSVARGRRDLQELISDISHQVKTPIANLQMVNATLIEQPMPEARRREFLQAANGQLEKLNFLMQAMIKTSRLETGVISLEKRPQSFYGALAAALGGILLNAERKNINVSVDCPQNLMLSHDSKWTSEALFNILDNAVKYTLDGGWVRVSVQCWELHVRIDIADSGKGIPESRQGMIFKRFYREEEIHDTDGIGIGLYLAREIIMMQGGWIKVSSQEGKGATFTIFLPRE